MKTLSYALEVTVVASMLAMASSARELPENPGALVNPAFPRHPRITNRPYWFPVITDLPAFASWLRAGAPMTRSPVQSSVRTASTTTLNATDLSPATTSSVATTTTEPAPSTPLVTTQTATVTETETVEPFPTNSQGRPVWAPGHPMFQPQWDPSRNMTILPGILPYMRTAETERVADQPAPQETTTTGRAAETGSSSLSSSVSTSTTGTATETPLPSPKNEVQGDQEEGWVDVGSGPKPKREKRGGLSSLASSKMEKHEIRIPAKPEHAVEERDARGGGGGGSGSASSGGRSSSSGSSSSSSRGGNGSGSSSGSKGSSSKGSGKGGGGSGSGSKSKVAPLPPILMGDGPVSPPRNKHRKGHGHDDDDHDNNDSEMTSGAAAATVGSGREVGVGRLNAIRPVVLVCLLGFAGLLA